MGYESLSPRRPMHSSTALSSKYGAVNYVGTPSNLRRKDFLQVKGSIIFYVNLCKRSWMMQASPRSGSSWQTFVSPSANSRLIDMSSANAVLGYSSPKQMIGSQKKLKRQQKSKPKNIPVIEEIELLPNWLNRFDWIYILISKIIKICIYVKQLVLCHWLLKIYLWTIIISLNGKIYSIIVCPPLIKLQNFTKVFLRISLQN